MLSCHLSPFHWPRVLDLDSFLCTARCNAESRTYYIHLFQLQNSKLNVGKALSHLPSLPLLYILQHPRKHRKSWCVYQWSGILQRSPPWAHTWKHRWVMLPLITLEVLQHLHCGSLGTFRRCWLHLFKYFLKEMLRTVVISFLVQYTVTVEKFFSWLIWKIDCPHALKLKESREWVRWLSCSLYCL